MAERCYIHAEELQKLTPAATSRFSYVNVTLYDDWEKPARQARQYYVDCDNGCCWYVPDYCCPVSSSELINRVVAVVVTLVLVTAVVVIIFCGGVVLSRRRGHPFPWARRRRRHQQQQSCPIHQSVTGSVGSNIHLQQQLQAGLLNFVHLAPPPPYDASTEEERVLWILGLQAVSTPKPPDYDGLASGDVAMMSQTPPPYSERITLNPCDGSVAVDDAAPPTYDQVICAPSVSSSNSQCNHDNM